MPGDQDQQPSLLRMVFQEFMSLYYTFVLLIKYKLSTYIYPAFKRSPFKSSSNISTKPYFCDIYMENPFIKFLVAVLIHLGVFVSLINTKSHNLFKPTEGNTFGFYLITVCWV